MKVRYADYEADREEVARLMIEELAPSLPFVAKPEAIVKNTFHAIKDEHVIVVEDNGKIVGCAKFHVCPMWYGEQPMVFDMGMVVSPEYRMSHAGALLLGALCDEATLRDTILVLSPSAKNDRLSSAFKLPKRFRPVMNSYAVI